MDTFQEQQEFFQGHWPAMKDAAESGGADAVVSFINGFEDLLERRVLYVFARQGLMMQDWDGKGFDPYIAVCDAGIAELYAQAETEEDNEDKLKRLNGAHIISFNLAADLADCWPGDDEPRTEAQFRRGQSAAEDCLALCRPDITSGLANDYWAKGMHQVSLGDAAGATESFERSILHAGRAAREGGNADAMGTDGPFGVILGHGYAGIAKSMAGDPDGPALFASAMATFQAQCEDEEKKDDAEFGISQLTKVHDKYVS